MSQSIEQQRAKAIRAIVQIQGATDYLPVDYLIDQQARLVLNLPPRPEGARPYTTWMIGLGESQVKKKLSQTGINLIKRWEGLRTNAYLCPAGVWTIGYGHTKNVRQGMMISHQKAEELLLEDLLIYEEAIERLVQVPLNQNEFDALVSFTFNVGIGAFSKSSLLQILNTGDYQDAARQFSRWVRGGGQKLPGLVSRRKDEYNLFTKE